MSWIELAALAALFVVIYPYAVYPLLLAFVPLSKRPEGSPEPSISVLLSAYNEEGVIDEKIKNFLSLEYRGRSELIVMSDGSSDRTVEIAMRHSGLRVKVM